MTEEQLGTESVAPRPRLPFQRIADVAKLPEGERWLIDGFLTTASIAVLGAEPKLGKTFLTLGLAVAVASGTPALGRFHVPTPGPVLLFHAEDSAPAIRERIEAIAVGQGLAFESLPIHVITAEQLRLDDALDREKLEELLQHLAPKLLILDPLVRLHSGAESYVGHIAELFRHLRLLQRRYGVAILLTHHVSKNRAGSTQVGQSFRGSGDIHAAVDHGATLRRLEDGSVLLSLEHRAAPSPEPIAFRIVSRPGGATSFDIIEAPFADDRRAEAGPAPQRMPTPTRPVSIRDQVVELLQRAAKPLSQVSIRKALSVRNETLTEALRQLEQEGRLKNLGRMKGWQRTPQLGGETEVG